MKTGITFLTVALLLTATHLHAQQARPLDSAAASAALNPEPVRPKSYTKSIDPVVSRTYTKSARVVVKRRSGAVEELPYVEVPILFRKDTDELLDSVSAANVRQTAELLRPLLEKGAEFCIEGHASAEGDAEHNRELSALRAAKISALLSRQYHINGEKLHENGLGSAHALHPASAPESELQEDRRVLVVRTK